MFLEKSIARVEALMKGMVFDCRTCGQCVLRQTRLICPMVCPKGLRNGPCGGTLDGMCEVYPDKACVWVRIHERQVTGGFDTPVLLPSPDARLFNTSSYLNFLDGRDAVGRQPLPYLDLGTGRTHAAPQTASPLEAKLKDGWFVRTCEVRPPRGVDMTPLDRQVRGLKDAFDAVNATAFLNARPSLASPVTAARLVQLGVDAICQSTCRDHTKTSFVAELLQNQLSGVRNVLCLTGDSYKGVPKIRQVFDMDGALMLYEARHLREMGVVHFTGEALTPPPRPYLGAAINPFTRPAFVPIRRLRQKAAAGADFIQTQLVFDVPAFRNFMALVRGEKVHEDLFIIAGVPVVTSVSAFSLLARIPGVHVPAGVRARIEGAADTRAEGIEMARQTARELYDIDGVAGVHLMLFGPSHDVLPSVIEGLPRYRRGRNDAANTALSGGMAADPHATAPSTRDADKEAQCHSRI